MVGFVVKVVRQGGDWDRPIVVGANSEEHAVKLARAALRLTAKDSVIAKGVPDEAMSAAFGEQAIGNMTIRPDWVWQGERPAKA